MTTCATSAETISQPRISVLGMELFWRRWRCGSLNPLTATRAPSVISVLQSQTVASRLGNTPTICRKCYIHPEILTTYVDGALLLEVREPVEEELREDLADLRPEEVAVLTLLQHRLSLTLEEKPNPASGQLELRVGRLLLSCSCRINRSLRRDQ